MARKVFVSILGTSFYFPCKYAKGNFTSSSTRFVQQATIEYIGGRQWEDNDRFIFLLTNQAKISNWDRAIENRQHPFTKEVDLQYIGLQKELDNMQLTDKVQYRIIPEGKDENEMWQIFHILYGLLQEDDELYIDLTHSFRYIPMLVLVLCNYTKFLKNIKVKYISYGNYEARNEDGIAPIIDLLPLSILQDWTFAAADLIRNGNTDRLKQMTDGQALAPLTRLMNRRVRREVEQHLNGYVNALEVMIDNMKKCKGNTILTGDTMNTINCLKNNIDGHRDSIITLMPPIINKIHETFNGFDEVDNIEHPIRIFNGYEAAKWCYEHQLYQQALTIVHETIVTHVCCSLNFDWRNYPIRAAVGNWIRSGYKSEDWDNLNVDKNVLQQDNYTQFMLKDVFKWTTAKRNVYNHAGMTENDCINDETVNELGEKIEYLIRLKENDYIYR